LRLCRPEPDARGLELGHGSCWIGNVQFYLDTPEGKRLLSLPEGYVPVAPIIVGYPA
jgi:hypothetical protein